MTDEILMITETTAGPAIDLYIDLSLALAGLPPVSPEQRAGIRQYFSFAETMMAPLLVCDQTGE